MRCGAVVLVLLACTTVTPVPPGSPGDPLGEGRNENGLLGKHLSAVDGMTEALTDVLLSRRKGTISAATVVDDTDQAIALDVEFSGIPEGERRLSAKAQDAAGRDVAALVADDVAVIGPSGKARIRLALRQGLAEGFAVESYRVHLELRQANAFQYDTDRVFALARRWTTAVRPENVVVEAKPLAVGAVPDTKSPSKGAVTPRVFKPEILRAVQVPVATRTAPPAMPQEAVARPLRPHAPEPNVRTLARDVRLAKLPPLKPIDTAVGLPKVVTDANGRGPSSIPLPWFDAIRAPSQLSLKASKLTTIDSTVFQDANPASGLWYYLPARYVLAWDRDNGHSLRITYGSAVGDKQPVYLSSRLTAGVDSAEVSLVRELLRAQLRSANIPFTDLRPMPFRDAPQISFQGQLGQFDVPPEKVAVTAISDIAGEMDVSVATDPVTTAVLQTTLTEGLGLPGSATFTAAGPEPFTRTIPVTIRAPDVRSYGTVLWKRGALFRNRTPFPMLARYLHFLTIAPDGLPTVHSYALDDVSVPAQAQLRVADATIPRWLDGELKAWIEYAVLESDEAGVRAIRDEIGLDAFQATTHLTVTTLTPFAGSNVARLVVDVRSRYFDPKDRDPAVRTCAFSKDSETANVGPLYLDDRSLDDIARPGDPLFSWRLTIIGADGTSYGPGPWTDGTRLELYLGQVHVQAVMGAP